MKNRTLKELNTYSSILASRITEEKKKRMELEDLVFSLERKVYELQSTIRNIEIHEYLEKRYGNTTEENKHNKIL